MKKRVLPALLALTMVVSLLPVSALATGTEVEDLLGSEAVTETAPEPNAAVEPEVVVPERVLFDPEVLEALPDNDTLFLGYVQQTLYGGSSGTDTYGNYGETLFSGDTNLLTAYRELKTAVAKVANGSSTSTVFTLSVGYDALSGAANYQMLINVLLADCPYDLYWHDKTAGYVYGYDNGKAQFTFDVATAYWDGTTKKTFEFSNGTTGTYRVGTD